MTTSTLDAPDDRRGGSGRRLRAAMAWYGVSVLVLATVFGAVDRQILVLLAEPVRRSLELSDTRLGMLQGLGITLFGGLAALPVAWMADRFGRRLVLAGSVLVWGGATAVCGFAHSFGVLFAGTVGLGIGEAAIVPIIYALIPEIVPARRRMLVNGIYALASVFGAGLGMGLSGYFIQLVGSVRPDLPVVWQAYETWRLAFMVVAIPAPLVALMLLLIRRHPERESLHAVAAHAPTTLFRFVHANARVVLGAYVGIGLSTFGLAAAAQWLPVVAARQFGAEAFDIGRGFGAAYLSAAPVGALVGSLGARWLRARLGVAMPIRVVASGFALSGLIALASPWATAPSLLYALFAAELACVIGTSVLMPTMLQDMLPISLRSRGIALCTFLSALLASASPVVVGLLSDAMSSRNDGLLLSVTVVQVASLLCGAGLLRLLEPAFARLVARLQD